MITTFHRHFSVTYLIIALLSDLILGLPSKAQVMDLQASSTVSRVKDTSIDYYLGQAIRVRKTRRTYEGLYETAVGTTFMALAISDDVWKESVKDSDRYTIGGFGLLFYSFGLGNLLVVSKFERSCGDVLTMSDPDERWTNGDALLRTAAEEGHHRRFMSGICFMLIAGYHFIARPYNDSMNSAYYLPGAVLAGVGIGKLFLKSPEERLYQNFLTSSSDTFPESFSLSFQPLARHQLSLVFSIR